MASTTFVANTTPIRATWLNDVNTVTYTTVPGLSTTKADLASPTFTGTVTLPSTTSIGTVSSTELSYLDGVTSAIQTQLDLKAPLASPTFTGVPVAPTAAAATNTTQIATTAFVTTADNLKANKGANSDITSLSALSTPLSISQGGTGSSTIINAHESLKLLGLSMLNGTFVPSVSSNALTIAIKTKAGTNPSSTDPVTMVFRSPTITSGDYVSIDLTSAISITIPSGATLGASNNVAFRVWLVGLSDGADFRIGVMNCAGSSGIYPLRDDQLASSVDMTTGSDSAQVLYSTGAVSGVALTVLGYFEYSSGLATAGTYNVVPTKVQLFGPGVTLPGGTIRQIFGSYATEVSNNSGTFIDTGLTASIAPSSAANRVLIQVSQNGLQKLGGANASMALTLLRGGSGIDAFETTLLTTGDATQITVASSTIYLDAPGTTSSTTYKTQFATTGGTTYVQKSSSMSTILLTEIMG